MIKMLGKTAIGIMLAGLVFVVWIAWDNNRITIEKQDVQISDLPSQFEGYRILQVTDLHEKEFGKDQEGLIEKINAVSYDAIVFTGDMLDGTGSENYRPFYTLIEGIKDKKLAFFVPGNADPYSYKFDSGLQKSAFVQGMEERGVKLLESQQTIRKEGASLSFVNYELAIKDMPNYMRANEGTVAPPFDTNKAYLQYRRARWEEISFSLNDTVIALNHYPVPDPRVDFIKNDGHTDLKDIDLLLAGHYHGGQIRLPFLGALFIPEAWYGNGFFPPQNRVKGLWEYGGMKQYVSTGLGSSNAVSFLQFRLFNPPEINIITLKGE